MGGGQSDLVSRRTMSDNLIETRWKAMREETSTVLASNLTTLETRYTKLMRVPGHREHAN